MWQRILRVAWTERVTNVEVLRRMGTKREIFTQIRKRQLKFVGHVVRAEQLESVCLTGRIEGRRGRGRPRQVYMDGICTAMGDEETKHEVLTRMRRRDDWRRSVVAYVQENSAPW